MSPSHCLAGARSGCPLANTLDLLGDRWTLLVVRDLLFFDKHRFGDFLSSPEGIPTNILTERLRRLEECGMVTKELYQSRPQRYEYHLTEKGTDLLPVLSAIAEWAHHHIPGMPAAIPAAFLARAQEAIRRAAQPPGSVEG